MPNRSTRACKGDTKVEKDLSAMPAEEKRRAATQLLERLSTLPTAMGAAWRNNADHARYIIGKAEEGTDAMWAVEYMLGAGLDASYLAFITGATTA